MKTSNREKRNIECFIYKNGYDGTQPHTLFDCAIKFDLTQNQVWLNNRKLRDGILSRAKETDIPTVAQEFNMATSVIERVLADGTD